MPVAGTFHRGRVKRAGGRPMELALQWFERRAPLRPEVDDTFWRTRANSREPDGPRDRPTSKMPPTSLIAVDFALFRAGSLETRLQPPYPPHEYNPRRGPATQKHRDDALKKKDRSEGNVASTGRCYGDNAGELTGGVHWSPKEAREAASPIASVATVALLSGGCLARRATPTSKSHQCMAIEPVDGDEGRRRGSPRGDWRRRRFKTRFAPK